MAEDRPKPTAPAPPWPAGGSEMAGRIRTHDWASTALGPIEGWPQSLRTVVDLTLANPVANILVCGPGRILIYNDACIRLYGDKHPHALGLEGPYAFPELWDEIGPLYDRVFAGEQLAFEAQPWAFERGATGGDGLYDAWFTPGRGEDGEVAFAFVTAVEVTDGAHANQALRKSEERQTFLLRLSDALRPLSDSAEMERTAMRLLGEKLGADRVFFATIEADGEFWSIRHDYTNGAPSRAGRYPMSEFQRKRLPQWRAGRMSNVADSETDPSLGAEDRAAYAAFGARAAIAVPLVKGGRWAALLAVNSARPRAWTEAELALTREAAERIWTAIEHARAEEALRTSEERLGLAVEIGGVGHWELDLATGELSTSALCRRNFGRPADEPFGYDQLRASIHPDDADRQQRTVAAAIEARSAFELEYRLLAPNGEQRWIDMRGRFEDGGAERLVGVSLDITGRKRAEAALRESGESVRRARDYAEATLRTSPVPLLVLESDLRVATANDAFYERFEVDPAQTEGRLVYDLGNGQWDIPRLRELLEEILPEHSTFDGFEVAHDFEHIGPRTMLLNGRRMEVEAGGPERIVLVVEDITPRKRAEDAVRASEERQVFLLKLSDALRPLADPNAIAEAACHVLVEHLNASRAQFTEVEGGPGDEIGEVRGEHVRDGRPMTRRYPLAAFGEPLVTALRAGETLVLTDTTRDPRLAVTEREAFAAVESPAAVAVPLVKDGRFVANLTVHDAAPREWTRDEVALVEDVAERTWAAIERARAEAALRTSEERFRGFAENSADVLWILNGETGRLEYLGPAFESVWGESRDAVMRDIRRWSETIHPDDRDEASRGMPLLLAGKTHTATYRIVRPNGDIRWIRDTGFPIHDDGTKRVGGIAQDITELKEIEERLATEDERSRLALEVGRLATWDWNLPENTVAWNDEHFRMQGYRVGEVEPSYEAWSARIHPEDLETTHEALARARDEHGQYRHEFRNLLPDGAVTWCLAHGRFFYAPDGTPERMIGVMEDVTQRRFAEDALRESEAHLQLIYDSLDEYAIITLDRKGFVKSWNEGAERLLGYGEAEAVGMNGRAIFTPEDLEQGAAEREIETALGTGRAANERWHVRKDGSRFWGSGAVLTLLNGDGDSDRNGDGNGNGEPVLVKIMRDETARRDGEEKLRESESRLRLLLAELQHRVRNLLGMVRSLVRRSSHGYVDLDEFLAHLIGRLDALGRTQIMITRGIDARVDLETLIRDELAVQTEREELFDLEGPDVALSAKAAEVLSLALHELATNSLKYGVLGEGEGWLDVTWTLVEREGQSWLELRWDERGRSISPARRRTGFGTELIEQRVPYELQGEGALEITAGGVEARISFPLADRASLLEAGAPRELR